MVAIVCAVGYDFRRILDGIRYWTKQEPLESVYLFFDNKADKYGYISRGNVDALADALVHTRVPVHTLGFNPQSYCDTLKVVFQILHEETGRKGRHVIIDATSTTKEAYGAIMTASLMFAGVRVFVVPAKNRGDDVPDKDDPRFREWLRKKRGVRGGIPQEIYLPEKGFVAPDLRQRMVLHKILGRGGSVESVSSLIRLMGDDPFQPVVKNRYGRLAKRLVSSGYVKEMPSASGKGLKLTEFGRSVIDAIDQLYGMTVTDPTEKGGDTIVGR